MVGKRGERVSLDIPVGMPYPVMALVLADLGVRLARAGNRSDERMLPHLDHLVEGTHKRRIEREEKGQPARPPRKPEPLRVTISRVFRKCSRHAAPPGPLRSALDSRPREMVSRRGILTTFKQEKQGKIHAGIDGPA